MSLLDLLNIQEAMFGKSKEIDDVFRPLVNGTNKKGNDDSETKTQVVKNTETSNNDKKENRKNNNIKVKTNLKINNSCIECGACLACGCDFLYNKPNGSIGVKEGIILNKDDIKLKKLKEVCPVDAFELDVTVDKNTVLKSLIDELVNNFEIKEITESDVRFRKSEYSISLPSSSGHRRFDYSSYDRASKAGLQEVKSKMFSRIDSIIIAIVSEYIVKKGKPYFSDLLEEGSVYVINNKKINQILEGIKSICGDKLPSDFANITFIPRSEYEWKDLRKGEYVGRNMLDCVKAKFDWSIDDFDCYIDVDDRECMVGWNWRDEPKYKTKYCYENLTRCYQEIADNVLDACYYADDDLEGELKCRINSIIIDYNFKMRDIIYDKIKKIEEATGQQFNKKPNGFLGK